MADVYATIEQADAEVQRALADVLELRAMDPQQRAMLDTYLAELPLRSGARVLEVGCGTGAVCRKLATLPDVDEVIGIDPSPVFVERAGQLAEQDAGLSFLVGDGRNLPFRDEEFDAIVCHTSLSHIPEPERMLAEALRVAAGGGRMAVFDGDYVTTTVAVSAADPLQACVDAAVRALVHDPLLVRRLPSLVRSCGWTVEGIRSHGYLETEDPVYTLTLIDRGADVLAASGEVAEETAEALKAEARRRVEAGTFFGHIAYASLIARRQ